MRTFDIYSIARMGILEGIRLSKTLGVDISAPSDINGGLNTVLHIAARFGHIQIVNYWLDEGLPLNIRNRTGATPLLVACRNRHSLIAQRLHAAGASSDIADEYGRTIFHEIAYHDLLDLGRITIPTSSAIDTPTANSSTTPLMIASGLGHTELRELFLQHGANDGSPNWYGYSANRLVAFRAELLEREALCEPAGI